jgi:hypothetical protein
MKTPAPFLTVLAITLAAGAMALHCGGSGNAPGPLAAALSADPVVLSFAAVGCSRVADADASPADYPVTNLNQSRQTFTDLMAMDPMPSLFFNLGDMVNGYKLDDGSAVKSQLDNWSSMFWGHPVSNAITLVPVPGNHELLSRTSAAPAALFPAAYGVWSGWLAENQYHGFGGNGPTVAGPNPDNLVGDNSQFSFSFDQGAIHFVMLNTDTATTNNQTGMVPMAWLAQDLDAAQANPKTRSILVMGHKPVNPAAGETGVDGAINTSLTQPMTDLLVGHAKVKAYICAHAHLFETTRLGSAQGPLQLISGTGGTKPESFWNPSEGQTFGFVVVKAYQSGKITYTRWTRPVPVVPNYAGPTVPAVPGSEVVISN